MTAEYGMLPRATGDRMRREAASGKQGGRHAGNPAPDRALVACRMRPPGARAKSRSPSICDVIQADGGTRTAAITGGFIAPHDCLTWMEARQMASVSRVVKDHVAAISCGIHQGQPVIDLDYDEDSTAETDANFVMTGFGRHRRDPGHGRRRALLRGRNFSALLKLAKNGISRLVGNCRRWRSVRLHGSVGHT